MRSVRFNTRTIATDLLNLILAAPIVNRCNIGGKCGYDACECVPEKNSVGLLIEYFRLKLSTG